jgi:hypothetical protein
VTEPPDLRRLVGEDVSPEELARLRRADEALRAVGAPPPVVPKTLTEAVARVPTARSPWTRRRTLAGLALAAALAAGAFGLGTWVSGDEFEAKAAIPMHPTANAPRGAHGVIELGPADRRSGNYTLALKVSGLPKLPRGGYYVLWLAKGRRYAATCGTFNVGRGETEVYMNVSYDLTRYDAWVVTAVRPGQPVDAPHPWLLEAPTTKA